MFKQSQLEYNIIHDDLAIIAKNVEEDWFSAIPTNSFNITRGVFACACKIEIKSIVDVVKDNLKIDQQYYHKDMPKELKKGCNDYKKLLIGTINTKFYLGIFLSLMTSITRYLIIFSIKWIGISSLSKETKRIKDAVFIFSFFNTGLLVLLINADFSYVSRFFTGKYSDFNAEWYSDVGSTIISSLVFTAVYPIIEILLFGGINLLIKAAD